MTKSIDSQGREWVTREIKGTGISRQATRIDNTWYISARTGYSSKEEARRMHPVDLGCLLDTHESGLVTVLCKAMVRRP